MEGGIQGLVIVFSACMIQVLAFGNYSVVGIYTVYLLEEFNEDTVGVSLISSIHFALLLGCGPLISFLMTKISYRKLSIFGALLVFVGILGTPLFMHLPSMYLFFGVFAGLGGCFIYLPSHVLSGLYYDKYRSLSTGVATTGTGLGAIVMPIIVGNLIEEYTWKGSLLILAGLDLHLLVFAFLMLPPPTTSTMMQSQIDDEYRLSELCNKNGSTHDRATKPPEPEFFGANSAYEQVNDSSTFHYDYGQRKKNSQPYMLYDADTGFNRRLSIHKANASKGEERNKKPLSRANSSLPEDDISIVFQPSYLSWATNLSIRGSVHYESLPSFVKETDLVQCEPIIPSHDSLSSQLANAMLLKSDTLKHKNLKETLKHHFLLLVDFKFFVYFISTVLWSLSTIIFVTFGPELIVMKGQSKYDATMVFTFFGVGQLLGCIFISILGNCIGKRVFLYIVSNSLTGIFIGIAPLYDSYSWIVMVCLCSGLAYGGILGLYMIVMVDIVGVEDMEIGLGYVMLASGIGCFAGPPICGYLKEVYEDYNNSFYLAGFSCIIAGFCMLLIYLKCCKEKGPEAVHV